MCQREMDAMFIDALRQLRDNGHLPRGRISLRQSPWWRAVDVSIARGQVLTEQQQASVTAIAQAIYAGSGRIVDIIHGPKGPGVYESFVAYSDPTYQMD